MSSVTKEAETSDNYGVIYQPDKTTYVIKKDGTKEAFNVQKVIVAVEKSAYRALTKFTDAEKRYICQIVVDKVNTMGEDEIPIAIMHNIVESALETVKPIVAKSYRDYRNYKQDFVRMLDEVYKKSQAIMYIGDKENANTDSALVSTKRSLVFNQFNKELYQKFFMTTEELQACREGYIYVHDMSARRDTMNCFARKTKFVTEHGIKSFMDYEDGDEIRVPSHLGIMRKAVVHKYGYQQLRINVFELVNGLRGSIVKTKEVVSTPNHRWLLKDETETTHLEVGDELVNMPEIIEGNIMPEQGINRSWKLKEIRPYNESVPEEVWCLEVEEDHSFLLEGGIPTGNCCLFDVEHVLKGGFEMGNIWYNEPKTLDTAFDVIGDVVLCAASQQYGGFTVPEVDKILEPYAKKSYERNVEKYLKFGIPQEKAEEAAYEDVAKEMEQGFQGWEYKFNTVASSRGDYPFITMSAGLSTSKFGKLASITMLNVRRKGQGKKGHKKPVLFPKLVFLYDENLHGPGKELEDVFDAGVECSRKTMYPDWLSLTGKGYVPSMYKQYGRVVSPMGCVDGKETVTYKFKYKIYAETFEQMWNRLAEHFEVKHQPAGPEHLYMDLEGVEIWDMMKGFVNTYRIIRNFSKEWVHITLSDGYGLTCTNDHPLTTTEGITKRADQLARQDYLYVGEKTLTKYQVHDVTTSAYVTSVQSITKTDYSYDVTTESEHFDVSGIWSHNCRAFLSPWYEKGGIHPADDNDKPVFVGRFNIGAVSLHLPMILAKSRQENKDFYEVLDYYLNLIRQLHIRTYAYLGEMRASTNPLAYCEGGFLGGHLGLHDKIKPVLKSATASFGITAFNELQMLYNGKSLVEDGEFAVEVLEHINKKVNEFKEEDGNLYAIYGTPAENLCLSGDTLVQCYGGNKQIKDITTDDLVYSYNEKEHKIELKKVVYSAKTGTNRQVVKITMDNGQEIICTPDHPIGVRRIPTANGRITGRETLEYVEAKDLKPNDRIKSNYIKLNERTGRLTFSIYHNGAKQLVQDVNAEYAYGPKPEGYVTHHKDDDKLNNLFSNLEYKTDADHRRHHMADTIAPFCYTSEQQKGENNNFYGKHHTTESNERNRKAHIGRSIECLSVDNSYIRSFECADDAEKAGYTRHMVVMACRGNGRMNVHPSGHGYKKMLWYYTNECPVVPEANHKVKSVEYMDELIDVYDITVEDNHNFFVGGDGGMLVHNCGLQVKQFRAKYGIVEGVSDREYVSNSFHCHVTENITPIQKQDLEYRFWDLCNGGKIQYVKYPIDYNIEAIKTLIRRAMEMGFYEGVNLSLAYCEDCGHQELEMDVCPECGSRNLTKIDRMNGYLSYSRVHGDTRLNSAKMAEIAERKSM